MELLDGFGVRDEKISALNERRRSQPDPPLVKSTAIGMNGSRTNTVKMIRPALEQLQERQRQLQAMKRHDEDSS